MCLCISPTQSPFLFFFPASRTSLLSPIRSSHPIKPLHLLSSRLLSVIFFFSFFLFTQFPHIGFLSSPSLTLTLASSLKMPNFRLLKWTQWKSLPPLLLCYISHFLLLHTCSSSLCLLFFPSTFSSPCSLCRLGRVSFFK